MVIMRGINNSSSAAVVVVAVLICLSAANGAPILTASATQELVNGEATFTTTFSAVDNDYSNGEISLSTNVASNPKELTCLGCVATATGDSSMTITFPSLLQGDNIIITWNATLRHTLSKVLTLSGSGQATVNGTIKNIVYEEQPLAVAWGLGPSDVIPSLQTCLRGQISSKLSFVVTEASNAARTGSGDFSLSFLENSITILGQLVDSATWSVSTPDIVGNIGEELSDHASFVATYIELVAAEVKELIDVVPSPRMGSENEVCGNSVCNLEFESCSSCPDDCRGCETQIFATVNNQLSSSVSTEWNPSEYLGAASVEVSFEVKEASLLLLRAVVKENFDTLKEIYTDLANPDFTAPPGACFSGVSFLWTQADVDVIEAGENYTIAIVLEHLAVAQDTSVAPSLYFRNTEFGNWTLIPQQEYNMKTFELKGKWGSYGEFAVYYNKVSNEALANFANSLLQNITIPAPSASGDDNALSNELLKELQGAMTSVSDLLQPGDPPTSFSVGGITMQVEKVLSSTVNSKSMEIAGSTSGAKLPDGFSSDLPDGADVINLLLIAVDPVNANSSEIIDFSIFGGTNNTEIKVQGLENGIDIVFKANGEPMNQRVCRFWNEDKIKENCTATATTSCVGDWDQTGLTLMEELSSDTITVCRSSHLTSFSIGFEIAAPDVSLDNFDPSKSKMIYIVFGSFFAFSMIMLFYSYVERVRYDQRQVKLALGEIIEDDVPEPRKPIPPGWKGWYFVRVFKEFKNGLTKKHNWIAVVWPAGKRVYPTRFLKVYALMAGTAMAFGFNAIFAFTAHQAQLQGRAKPNTMVIDGTVIPMFGFYSFFMALPLMLTLSLGIGHYAAYINILQKVAPKRFRSMTPRVRKELQRRGLLEEDGKKFLSKEAAFSRSTDKLLSDVTIGMADMEPDVVETKIVIDVHEEDELHSDDENEASCSVANDEGYDGFVRGLSNEEQQKEVEAAQVFRNHQFQDLASSLNFSRTQVKQMYRDFRSSYKNGLVAMDDFEEVFARFYEGDAALLTGDIFPLFDTNDLGKLSYDEFVGFVSVFCDNNSEDRLKFWFEIHDMNKDNKLSSTELKSCIASLFSLSSLLHVESTQQESPEFFSQRIFSDIDLDPEGSISSEAFLDFADNNIELMEVLHRIEDATGLGLIQSETHTLNDTFLSQSEQDLTLIADNEYSEDVEELIRKMNWWQRFSTIVGSLCFLAGLLLALIFMGSLDEDDQRDWLASFGEFLVMSAIITAPIFILIASAFASRKKELEELERIEKEAAEAALDPNQHAKNKIKAMIQTELGRNVRQQLLTFHVF